MPTTDAEGKDTVTNAFTHYWSNGNTAGPGPWEYVAMLGAFAGYAGGGGLSNSAYGNFVRDKGWGMGSQVGAIASAVGGRGVSL
jgi:hypothetical protein